MKCAVTFLALTFTLLLSFSKVEASGSRVGNGGVGVVCQQGFAPKLLDLYEATEFYGRTAFFNPWDQRSQREHTLAYTQRLQEIVGKNHPIMQVLEETALLRSSMTLVEHSPRITTDAGLFTWMKEGCRLVQVAARGESHLSGQLEILKSYWFGISEHEKALTLIHEALHTWFVQPGSDYDVIGTLAMRQMIGLLYTDSTLYPRTSSRIRELVSTRQPLSHDLLTSDNLSE